MENRKFIKIILILVGMLSIPIFNIRAYDAETTHPALTQEVIKLFESQYSQYPLSEKEKNILEKGSAEEDSPTFRCLAHFYDPIYEQGLYGNITTKKWAEATKIQAVLDLKYTALLANISQNLFTSETDFSFDRAVFEYVHGDKLRGLEGLGHILHLIEDMAVPPHTRNDGHPLGSPYEEYAEKWTKDNIDIAGSLILNDKKVIIYNNLDDYFYNLAIFTNQNFFSEDTIFTKKYFEPVVDYEKEEVLSDEARYKFGFNKIDSRLIRIREYFDFETKKLEKVFVFQDKDNLILTDYWNALSKQAVLYGAGVMRLFFEAVEEEKQTLALYKKNRSGFDTVVAGAVDIGKKTASLFSNLAGSVRESLAEIDSKDMLAGVGSSEGEGDFVVEVVGGSQQLQPQNHPEDPNSPELQRLAMILREAEKMVKRLETGISDLEKQNVGGAKEKLVINNPLVDKVGKTEEPASNLVSHNYGGGGGATPTPATSSPSSSSISQTSSAQTTSTTTPSTATSAPTITTPANFSQFATTTIDFSGTASSTQIISTDFSTATTTVDQSDNWDLTLSNFAQGTTTIQFFATDNQNTSSSTEVEIFVDTVVSDTTAPDIASLEITQCDNSMVSNSCLIATTTLDILWATTTISTDFAYFNIDENGIFSTTTATTTQITNLTDGDTYTFSVATVDTNGNASATTTKTATINQMPIVINEIAWAGTSATTPNDEWIELYNRSNENINLDDWILYSQDGSPELSLANTILAGEYYLIERTDDTTVSDITADLVIPFSGQGGSGLGNTGEHLILAYKKSNQATTTIDEVPFGSGWPTGDGYRTLEKYNPNLSGTDTNNWDLSIEYSASFDLLNGLDANDNMVLGTPKARNSINYKIAKDDVLTENKTITKANSPYFVGSDGLTIEVGKTLTIESGVVIKLVNYNSVISVNGNIEADASSGEPIIFTSFYDDEGGDTNGDGDCSTSDLLCPGEANNFWPKLSFTSVNISNFNNTIFRYGGNSSNPMVVLDNATVNFASSTFEKSRDNGLSLVSATSIVNNCDFKNNKKEIEKYGLYSLNSSLSIQNSVFDNNQIGLGLFNNIGAIIDSNTFNNHSGFPVIVGSSPNIEIIDNSGENNATNGISIFGTMTNTIATTTLSYNSLPYILDNALTVSENTALEIGPKTVFKFAKSGAVWGSIGVSGYLNINGGEGEENRVLFTSGEDDSDGVDVYNNGQVATSTILKKGGINFQSATSTIENAEFRYLDKATAYYSQSAIDLKDVVYQYNTWSIYADPVDTPVTRAENVSCSGTTNTTGICQ